MKKDVKIIKRVDVGAHEDAKSSHQIARIDSGIRINQYKAVKDWVSERVENRKRERADSENIIRNWRISIPKTS
jgi:hypothetical protein